MTEDEFKNVGRYFADDEYATLPIEGTTEDCAIEGWFVWLSGDGPLFATTNGDWAFVYDHDGQCAYRVGGVERVTSIAVDSVQGQLDVSRGSKDW